MLEFARTADAIGATSSKLEKTRLLAGYLRRLDPPDLRLAATWMTGRPFSLNDPRTLQLGSSSMWKAVQALTGADPDELGRVYLKHSDPGDWAEEVLAGHTQPEPASLQEVGTAFAEIEGANGAAAKVERLTVLLARLDLQAAKYVVKTMANDLRIGLQEGLVEEAIAEAFELPLATVKRVHMLTGDLGETAVRAHAGETAAASIELFRPIRFMLAAAVPDAAEAMERVGGKAWTEEKYDGVRCQLHRTGTRVALYSRDLRETTAAFPEVAEAAAKIDHDLLIDGEILAHRNGKVLRFFELQRRLGRKVVAKQLLEEVPVVLVAFDLLHLDGEPLLDRPLRERRNLLEGLHLEHPFLLARFETATGAEELDRIFVETRERGNEGLMLKNPESSYTPGRRGLSWLKLKRPLATLDCVVTAVEWGHGKRHGVLSDYTFAVRDEVGDRLVNVGKAYTGLTDAEIATMTDYFLEHTVVDHGRVRLVEPDTVVEVAFDSIQRSARHKSGFALRFPRIVRLRDDKTPKDIDTLAEVEALYQRFFGGESQTDLAEVAEPSAKVTFMGTAGARFMVAKQLAASGGLYLEDGSTRIALDPGPGAIVQYAKRKVDPARLSGIVLSHRHLDHSGDVNVMIEAMTEGGFKRRGRLFCPSDALDDDPVVLGYLRGFPEEVVRLQPQTRYLLGSVEFTTTPAHPHGAETYGFRFGDRLGWVTDSGFYEGIAEQHRAEVMIIHTVLLERRPLPHLCLDDAEAIIREARPRLAILTHFGMTMWRAHPWELAARLTETTGIEVKAARDGMTIEL